MATKNPSVAFRPSIADLARVDYEAQRTGKSRYSVISDLVTEALDTRGVARHPELEITPPPTKRKRNPDGPTRKEFREAMRNMPKDDLAT